jgi:hypothetical protein
MTKFAIQDAFNQEFGRRSLGFWQPEEVKKLIDRLREELLWMALVLSFVVNWFFSIRFAV